MFRCLGDYPLRSVTKEVITVLEFNRRRRLEDKEKLCRCLTIVGVNNACRDVVCRAQNLLMLSNSVVLRFRLVEADIEPIKFIFVEAVEVLDFVEVRQHVNC